MGMYAKGMQNTVCARISQPRPVIPVSCRRIEKNDRVAMAVTITWQESALDPEIGIQQMADGSVVVIKIVMATIYVSAWPD